HLFRSRGRPRGRGRRCRPRRDRRLHRGRGGRGGGRGHRAARRRRDRRVAGGEGQPGAEDGRGDGEGAARTGGRPRLGAGESGGREVGGKTHPPIVTLSTRPATAIAQTVATSICAAAPGRLLLGVLPFGRGDREAAEAQRRVLLADGGDALRRHLRGH